MNRMDQNLEKGGADTIALGPCEGSGERTKGVVAECLLGSWTSAFRGSKKFAFACALDKA